VAAAPVAAAMEEAVAVVDTLLLEVVDAAVVPGAGAVNTPCPGTLACIDAALPTPLLPLAVAVLVDTWLVATLSPPLSLEGGGERRFEGCPSLLLSLLLPPSLLAF
jgi:hypothetical protein